MKQFAILSAALMVLGSVATDAQMLNQRPLSIPGPGNHMLSYAIEDFEGAQFPPSRWSLEFKGEQYWARYWGASAFGEGSASAVFNVYSALPGTTQSLVLVSMGSSGSGDSLYFDHANTSYSGQEIDKLVIETSANGGATYSLLKTLNGGQLGELVTAPPTTEIFVPTASQWASKHYALPVGTNRVRFKAISAFGNNIYIDNCRIGTQPSVDVGVSQIDFPSTFVTGSWAPNVIVQNFGSSAQTFDVTLLISPEGYSSTRTVTALAPNEKTTIQLDTWNSALGVHDLTAFTALASDQQSFNDTLQTAVSINSSSQVANISALAKSGQVFVTWDNIPVQDVAYTLYRSSTPIRNVSDLAAAQNLGKVFDNSALDERMTQISGGTPTYLKIDSAASPISSTRGLFVATSTGPGDFYYAVTTTLKEVEDTTILVGSNALVAPVHEDLVVPQPIWQESRFIGGKTFDIYVQFATKITSSIYPQMTNAGSFPFHFAIVKSGSQSPHPLTFWLHWGYGTFLEADAKGTGAPNEWIITIDDWIPNMQCFTYFYGYHEEYDIHLDQNPIPVSGIVYNYTAARVTHTLDWAIRSLPVDSTRVYMTGESLGAMGTLLNAFMIPKRIAAFFIFVPQVDLSVGNSFSSQWGTMAANLLTNEGLHRNERVNANFLASMHRSDYLPIMYTFCGKLDAGTGWPEKTRFYDSLNAYRLGGFHFWSLTDHYSSYSPWKSSFPNFSFFTRYRTNLSYPAFSNCSFNEEPGNGNPYNGADIGTINGHVDWNDDIVDSTDRWEATLFVKDLATTQGTLKGPDSGYADVTIRRLQVFKVPDTTLSGVRDTTFDIVWWNEKDNTVIQHGSFDYSGGPITIPSVKVFKSSSRLIVKYVITGIQTQASLPDKYSLSQNYPNPFNPTTTIKYTVAGARGQGLGASEVRIVIYDVLGREVAVLVNARQMPGEHEVRFDGRALSSGVYFYRLSAGSYTAVRRMLLVR